MIYYVNILVSYRTLKSAKHAVNSSLSWCMRPVVIRHSMLCSEIQIEYFKSHISLNNGFTVKLRHDMFGTRNFMFGTTTMFAGPSSSSFPDKKKPEEYVASIAIYFFTLDVSEIVLGNRSRWYVCPNPYPSPCPVRVRPTLPISKIF